VTRVITPRLHVPPKPVPGPPKRFAEAMGAIMSSIAAVLTLGFGLELAADAILVMLIAAASLELPTLDGLRGYNAGLALAEAVRDGTDHGRIAEDLLAPAPFSDALMTPWRADAPAAGNQRFSFIRGNFLPPTLIPTSAGGESFNGTTSRTGPGLG
jgi:uncharacterized protein DUF4395